MKIINATPHALNICAADGSPITTIAPSGMVLRCAANEVAADPLGNIPTTRTSYGAVEVQGGGSVPGPENGVVYVVSALVRLASPERMDFLSPGPLVRNEAGQPIGCVGLTRT